MDAVLPWRLDQFAADAYAMTVDEFERTHGRAFLLHLGSPADLVSPPRFGRTVEGDGSHGQETLPHPGLLVFPVRKMGRTPFPDFISVGRTRNNDIVIDDGSLSKYHAFFREQDGGDLVLQDAGSTNGTQVDERRVPARGSGEAVIVNSGARVRIGHVELTFLRAPEFQSLVQSICDRPG